MNRTRIELAIYVDLDDSPGIFHSADSARNVIGNKLNQLCGSYNPTVSIKSYDTHKKSAQTRMEHQLVFDDKNSNWTGGPTEDRPEYNLIFLRGVENYLRQVLAIKGILFVNHVRHTLGFEETRDGQTRGWYTDPNNAKTDQFGLSLHIDRELDRIVIKFVDEGEVLDQLPAEVS